VEKIKSASSMRGKSAVTFYQLDGTERYRVAKTVNTLTPRIRDVLNEAEVNALIEAGVTVTITRQK
jgi:hypothetical protein